MPSSTHPQWLFPIAALQSTPTVSTSKYTLQRELYDRARGVEFLFRLGSSLNLFVIFFFGASEIRHFKGSHQCLTDILAPLQPCLLLPLGFIDSICDIQWRITIAKSLSPSLCFDSHLMCFRTSPPLACFLQLKLKSVVGSYVM